METTPTQTAVHASPTVLVVDDYAANCELVRIILENEGYRVQVAASGSEALASFAQDPPDCVLLDVKMPGIDGFAVCERLRADPRGVDTPIVFLTAMRDVDTFDRAALSGGDDYVTKPLHASELIIRVRMAIRLRKLSSERRGLFEELRDQHAALTRLQLQKAQLTSFLLNDLKVPVSSMALQAQSILHDPRISEDSRESARDLVSGARQLLRIILNLLDIGRGEQGALHPKRLPTDLAGLVRDVLAVMEAQAQAAGVALHTEGDALFPLDPGLIRRAVANLLDNAIHHAPVGSQVWVRIAADDAGLLLQVVDAGPGIAQERREAVFDRSSPLSADETAIGRTGLSLAFCKLAVEAHGGRIWIEDAGPGAILCVRVPHE